MSRCGEPFRSAEDREPADGLVVVGVREAVQQRPHRVDRPRVRRARAARARAAPSRGRPGSRPRARAAAAPPSGGSGTGRPRGRRPRARGSRRDRAAASSSSAHAARSLARSRSFPLSASAFASTAGLGEAQVGTGAPSSERGAGADVARGRPEEPPGPLLLEDVRRPAGDARAGEHRRRERRRNLGDVEHDRRVVLDVRREHALGMALLERLQRDLLELLGDLDLRRAELLRRALEDPRARVLGAVDAVAEAHDPLAATRARRAPSASASPRAARPRRASA